VNRRSITIMLMACGLVLIMSSAYFKPDARLIWNRSASAPEGLYWRNDHLPKRGSWVIVSPKAPPAIWAETHSLTGNDWPLVKRVAAISGDTVCREGHVITINDRVNATALAQTSAGENLPEWAGCHVLNNDRVFLLNEHPASLDGRYFGPTKLDHLQGTVSLIWRTKQ
jgi:type IV secretory pathway protease TraF